jgi:DNA-binding transcriptional ArsR family regulator
MSTATLKPTLWRTCRALANPTRLRILHLVLQQPNQTVSAVARQIRRPLASTSQYLRALEARGFLSARRKGRWVEYRPGCSAGSNSAACLLPALRATFQRDRDPERTIFRLATAFTHPRRILDFRALRTRPRTLGQLQVDTSSSSWALMRHLRKLQTRGIVMRRGSQYVLVRRADDLGRELARLAAEAR